MLRAASRARGRREGAALVEFAFIALAFYLLFAGTVEVGRMVFSLQTLRDASYVGARELAHVELPATASFDEALSDPLVRETVFDPGLLVLDTDAMDDVTFQQRINSFPALNRMLTPLMIRERLDLGAGEREYFHYPGAIVRIVNPGPFDPPFTVMIPKVVSRDADGVETIEWLPVVEEVRPDTYAADPATAPFSLASTGRQRGLVSLRVNYPYQAASMSAFLPTGTGVNTPAQANDEGVVEAASLPSGQELANAQGGNQTYSGRYGLGKQFALGQQVRPFRRLLTSQAMFRREVFSR
ncbi:MAG: pilus assembly protein [Planctomycetes bacterium]|nr:pilus assembly protein [Planctomycetota bacterium]